MLFFKPITLAIAIAAGARAAATPDKDIIVARAATGPEYHRNVKDPGGLPPCHGTTVPRSLPRDVADSLGFEIRDADDGALEEPNVDTDQRATYPSDYIPAKCNQQGFNCIYAQPGVSFSGGPGPVETYNRSDKTQVLVFKYWQPEVMFTAAGGTTVIYLAHDTIWTCAKGGMHAKTIIAGGDVRGPADRNMYDCVCTYVLSDDLVIWPN